MDDREKVLIENELYDRIQVFFELDDKKIAKQYAKEYFDKFCDEYNLDKMEVFNYLKELLESNKKQNLLKEIKDIRENDENER